MSKPTNLGANDVVRRVQIFKRGEDVVHPNGDFTVDDQFVRELVQSYEKITADGFRVPVLVEHQSDGRIYGEVVRLYEDSDGVYVDLELADGIREEWEKGLRRNVSPSIWKERPHPHKKGVTLKNLLREVSMVSVPHLKNLKPPPLHYSLHESGFWEPADSTPKEIEMTEEEEKDMEETPEEEDVVAMVKQLMERMDAMEAKMSDDAEMADDDDEEKEMSEQSKRIAELETKLAMTEVRTDIPGVKGTELTELAELKMLAPKQYDTIVKHRKKIDMSERGVTGTAEAGSLRFAQAKEKARQAGCKPGKQTLEYIDQHFPNVVR